MNIFQRLFNTLGKPAVVDFEAVLLPEIPFYVIGDIHGSDRLLARLFQKIDAEVEGRDATIICVGDYVDRGEDSAGVLRRLMSRSVARPEHLVCLAGNHEAMLLDFLVRPEQAGARWLRNGGLQTLASFRVSGVSPTMSGTRLAEMRDQFVEKIGPDLITWLETRPSVWTSGNVSVVHAAADPLVSLDMQSDNTLLWGHPKFLTSIRQDGQWVVHGHSIVPQVRAEQGRIAIDTGAFATGILSAVHVSCDGWRVLTT